MAHQQFAACIEACYACADACDHCMTSCLAEADSKSMARCIALDVDCAQLCRLVSAYMARDSEHATVLCATCADLCDACGEECEKFTDMEHCKQCAEACRQCAQACRQMSSTAGSGRRTAAVPPAH